MTNTPKYNIGDTLLNTLAVGDCTIVDIYQSPTSKEIVYKIETPDDMTGYYDEIDLQREPDEEY